MAKFKIDGVFYNVEMEAKSGNWLVTTEKDGEKPQSVNCGKEVDTALLFVLKDYIVD